MLLYKESLTAALGHCSYNYRDLLFTQMCSDTTAMHCSTGQCKLDSPLFSIALQNSLTAGLCHCSYTCRDLLFIQVCSDAVALHCSTGQGKLDSPLFSGALQSASQLACVTVITPMKICSSYRCAVTQEQCTAALGRANCIPHCSVLLCKTGSQLACVTAITPTETCSSHRCAVTQQ